MPRILFSFLPTARVTASTPCNPFFFFCFVRLGSFFSLLSFLRFAHHFSNPLVPLCLVRFIVRRSLCSSQFARALVAARLFFCRFRFLLFLSKSRFCKSSCVSTAFFSFFLLQLKRFRALRLASVFFPCPRFLIPLYDNTVPNPLVEAIPIFFLLGLFTTPSRFFQFASFPACVSARSAPS